LKKGRDDRALLYFGMSLRGFRDCHYERSEESDFLLGGNGQGKQIPRRLKAVRNDDSFA
jgi:hypothetical protein